MPNHIPRLLYSGSGTIESVSNYDVKVDNRRPALEAAGKHHHLREISGVRHDVALLRVTTYSLFKGR